MKPQTIAAGEFKAKCLRLLDEVGQEHKEFVVTKRGKPVARLVPVKPEKPQIFGRLAGTARTLGDIFSTGEQWDADR